MNHFFAFLLSVVLQLTVVAKATPQSPPHEYNPDSDGDGYVGVSDVLTVLSYFQTYFPIYTPSLSNVLLVSQDGCSSELVGEYWSGVTWVEPGMDTLFVPYGYDDVLIKSNYNCSGVQNVNGHLVIVLLNPPGSNEADFMNLMPPVFSVSQETRIQIIGYELNAIKVISWEPMVGWYTIKDVADSYNNQPDWTSGSNYWLPSGNSLARSYSKTYVRFGNEPWSRAD